jgi:hypothetical protein
LTPHFIHRNSAVGLFYFGNHSDTSPTCFDSTFSSPRLRHRSPHKRVFTQKSACWTQGGGDGFQGTYFNPYSLTLSPAL